MRKLASISGLLLAWLCANGALLDVVQVFAWGRMYAGYRETMTVKAALKETFDPAKPCHLCVSVAKARDAERPAQSPAAPENQVQKIVLVCEAGQPLVVAGPAEAWPASFAAAAPGRTEAVPVPPPRA